MSKGKLHYETHFQEVLKELSLELELLNAMPCLTYSYEDSNRSWHGNDGQPMPLWTPITSATAAETEILDQYLTFLYKSELMDEADLPPVYTKKDAVVPGLGLKRTASEAHLDSPMNPGSLSSAGSHPLADKLAKMKREDPNSASIAPRSLFDRSLPMVSKIRKDKASQRFRPTGPGVSTINMNAAATLAGLRHPLPRPQVDAENVPEWLIQEDWALLRAVREFMEMPLNPTTPQPPAHTANWDMVSDMVNAVSRVYRGPKQCRNRYESIIVPREEGRITYDVTATLPQQPNSKNKKKNSKAGGIVKALPPTKVNKVMKTSQLFAQDNNVTWTKLHAARFEQIKAVANRRTPTTKPLLVNPVQKNTKHAAVLAESGITYENPLSPIKVAANRAERIQKEKQRSQQDQQQLVQQQRVVAAQNAATQAQQVAAAQSAAAARGAVAVAASHGQIIQQQQPTVVAAAPGAGNATAQAVVVGISQPSGGTSTTQHVIVQGSPGTVGRLAAIQQQHQGGQQVQVRIFMQPITKVLSLTDFIHFDILFPFVFFFVIPS